MSFDAVGIICKDIQKSIEFYKILGVGFQQEGGPGHYEFKTSSGVRLMLDSVELTKQLNPNWKEPVGSGIVLCFKQESPKLVDELFNKVSEAGNRIIKEPWDAFWGQRYASVQDPDGNQIDLFATL